MLPCWAWNGFLLWGAQNQVRLGWECKHPDASWWRAQLGVMGHERGLNTIIQINRRQFRSQTSDNMDRWKAEQGRGREKRKIRREKIRRERDRRKKMQMREKVGKSRNTVFFQWFEAPEGRKVGSLKRRVRSQLARWEMKICTPLWREADFEVPQLRTTFGSWDVEKVHAVVARSIFPSQNVQNTPGSDHFRKLRCRKSARRWREAHFQVKMYKTHNCRTTFGSSDVEKCTPLWREAHFQVKMYKTRHVRATFGGSDVEKAHAVVARSTFRSENVQNTRGSDHFWRFRCRFAASLHYTTLRYITPHSTILHYIVTTLHYTTLHNTTTTTTQLDYTRLHSTTSNFTTLHYTTLRSTTLHYIKLHYTPLHYITLHDAPQHYNYNYTTTLHYTTLHYTTLHYTPLHYTTLHYTTLHYTTLPSTTLHYITLHYTTTTTTTTQLHSATRNYTTLHYITLHYTTFHDTPLHYTTLHYTTLQYTEWHCTTDRQVDRQIDR